MIVDDLDHVRILIREERKRQGLTIGDFPGVGRSTVAAFEAGQNGIQADNLFALLARLGLKMHIEREHAPETVQTFTETDSEIDMIFSIGGGR